MIGYASNTRTTRNLAALRAADWGILLTPDNPRPPAGFRYAIDNGAWKAFQANAPFDGPAFERLVESTGRGSDFIVLPDIVAGGLASLAFSLSWLPRLATFPRLLLPLQDGMDRLVIAPVLAEWPTLGLFLGGSTDWKLQNILAWGQVAAEADRPYHVGRVNTGRRIRLCAEAGATSFDGTSATRFACTLPLLDTARRQPSLLSPR